LESKKPHLEEKPLGTRREEISRMVTEGDLRSYRNACQVVTKLGALYLKHNLLQQLAPHGASTPQSATLRRPKVEDFNLPNAKHWSLCWRFPG
jgi:hypothetical protein